MRESTNQMLKSYCFELGEVKDNSIVNFTAKLQITGIKKKMANSCFRNDTGRLKNPIFHFNH